MTEVDGIAVSSKSLHEVQAMLRGEPGSNICVSFERSAPNSLAHKCNINMYDICIGTHDMMHVCRCAGTFQSLILVYQQVSLSSVVLALFTC